MYSGIPATLDKNKKMLRGNHQGRRELKNKATQIALEMFSIAFS